MVRKAAPQACFSRAEGSIPHGAELSTGGPKDQAAGRSEGAGGSLWLESSLNSWLTYVKGHR